MWKRIISEMSSAYLEQMYFGGGVCLLLRVHPSVMLAVCAEVLWFTERATFLSLRPKLPDLRQIRLKRRGLRFQGLRDSVNRGVDAGFWAAPAMSGGFDAGFQLAGCKSQSAGVDWKVNISYHMNPAW